MATSTLLFVILYFLAFSTKAAESAEKGISSSYCEKSRLRPNYYGPTPIECCDDRGLCATYIGANETKYGLTNTDPKWPRRHCNCDRVLFRCVMRDSRATSVYRVERRGFQHEICFREKFVLIDGIKIRHGYEFVPLLESIK